MSNLVRAENLGWVFDVSRPWLDRLLERAPRQVVTAVADVTFDIARRETPALVGESGSGKSTLARTVVGRFGRRPVFIDDVATHHPADRVARRRLRRRISGPWGSSAGAREWMPASASCRAWSGSIQSMAPSTRRRPAPARIHEFCTPAIPTTRLYRTSAANNPRKKLTIFNAPPLPDSPSASQLSRTRL
jgi:hypothetical protein